MGQLRNKRIVQSRVWYDPNVEVMPPYDYDYSYPITVYAAVMRDMEDNSTSLVDELESIYRLINDKQDRIGAGVAGQLMTWSGVEGQIGALDITKTIHPESADQSNQRIPTEQAVGKALDGKVSNEVYKAHADDNSTHITDIERNRWNGMASASTLNAHISNTNLHITANERAAWNRKAEQTDLDEHIININNPHRVTAHQIGAYNREEIDDMFDNLRESFFNHVNISWDDRSNTASLVEYHPANWNPNYVLEFDDDLPDVSDASLTYFALKPASDYQVNESQDCIIYIKSPGMSWREVGLNSMNMGDMVIRFPDTTMYVWVQGHFKMFGGVTVDSVAGGESDLIWRPSLNEEGQLVWTKSRTTEPPLPMTIKGQDGYTPIKGVDYGDGKDGEGVPVGGVAGTILTKVTDENYDTTWRTLGELLTDMVLSGKSLPEGVVDWSSIKNRPEWYNELGPNEDGFITQRAVSAQFDRLKNDINSFGDQLEMIETIKENLKSHLNDFQNPHRVTASAIGAVPIATFTSHINNYTNPHNITADQIGLGKVDNTRDMDKPISTATQLALNEINSRINNISSDLEGENYVCDVNWTNDTATATFTFKNGTVTEIKIPIAEVFSTIYFDDAERELVIVLPGGNEHRVDISSLIKPFTGKIGDNIQVVVEDNTIKASVLPGTIGELEISVSVHLRGSPTTTTQPVSDNSTRIATTEFVHNQVIDNLISYEPDRPLSANMGRILNQRKVDIDDIIQILNDIEGIEVVDNLLSTNPMAGLSANMGRVLDLEKAPRVHTSPSGSTFGRSTISLFGHSRASDIDPYMDGTVFRGTDDGYYARGDHRHPTDISRAPMHWPDAEHGQEKMTGNVRAETPPNDSNSDRVATTEWVRQCAVGVSEGTCTTASTTAAKVVTLVSDFMDDPTFLRQTGSTVVVTFTNSVTVSDTVTMNVQKSGAAPITYGGQNIITGMIKANHEYLFTFIGTEWVILNPSANFALPDGDNSDEFITAKWARRNIVGIVYGTCTTAAGTVAKVAKLKSDYMDPVIFLRQTGISVVIKFSANNTAANATLNVQNSGAAPITYGGVAIVNDMIKAGYSYLFTWNGTSWELGNPTGIHTLDDTDSSNSIVSSDWVRRNLNSNLYGTCATASTTANKVVTLVSDGRSSAVFQRQSGSMVSVSFTKTDTSGAATTLNVNGTGAATIKYAGRNLESGMLTAGYVYDFKFDGTYWQLMNPTPGTGFGTLSFSSSSTTYPSDSGHMGFTIEGYDSATDDNGYVTRLIATIRFPYHTSDVSFTISTGAGQWGARMGDGSVISLRNPTVMSTNRDSAVVLFTMDTAYPSNSPCMLTYMNAQATYTVTPTGGGE